MGKLLSSYKYSLIQEIKDNIFSNTSHYYAIASNPIEYTGTVPTITDDDFTKLYEFDSLLLFGKKLKTEDILPVINKNIWTSNTVYDRYDNYSNTLHTNNNFYVISSPSEVGGEYHVYKCIDNAGGVASNVNPSSIGTPTQPTTFATNDGYKWRYITSITNAVYDKFATDDFFPIYENPTIVATAPNYSGVEVIVISNTGSGYDAYTNGVVQSVVNTTLIQIANSASSDNNFYDNNAIYIYNTLLGTSQILTVNNYVSNSLGKWIYFDSPANTSIILSSQSEYIISPKVVFNTDGDLDPIAYCTINTTSNSIGSITILDIGSNITRANVSIQSNFGSGANLYAIVPPPGGHGFFPQNELNVKGMAISFTFANSESNTIITSNTVYNKIGIIKNPYTLNANNTKGSIYTVNTFSQVLKANVNPSNTFAVGTTLIGANSGARGVVVFSNSTQVFLAGDKSFSNGEFIGNSSFSSITQITINDLGDVYAKEITPLYIQNINNVNRSNTQNESYKIIIQV